MIYTVCSLFFTVKGFRPGLSLRLQLGWECIVANGLDLEYLIFLVS